MDHMSCTAAVILMSMLALAMSGSWDSRVHEFHNRVGSNDDTGRIENCGKNLVLC